MKIIEKDFNAQTNIETITQREMTDLELKEYEAILAKAAAAQTEFKVRQAARAALLDKLGITADEAALLLG